MCCEKLGSLLSYDILCSSSMRSLILGTRWAPVADRYKWGLEINGPYKWPKINGFPRGYNPYKWPYKWVAGGYFILLSGVTSTHL